MKRTRQSDFFHNEFINPLYIKELFIEICHNYNVQQLCKLCRLSIYHQNIIQTHKFPELTVSINKLNISSITMMNIICNYNFTNFFVTIRNSNVIANVNSLFNLVPKIRDYGALILVIMQLYFSFSHLVIFNFITAVYQIFTDACFVVHF